MATATGAEPATATACCTPLGSASLSDAEAKATARLFTALADPHRRHLGLLRAQPRRPRSAGRGRRPPGSQPRAWGRRGPGSGGGIDVLLSARRVGPSGRAYGLDMTEEMLHLARANAAEAGATNVEFLKGQIEAIPCPTRPWTW